MLLKEIHSLPAKNLVHIPRGKGATLIEFQEVFSTPFFSVEKSTELFGSDPYYRLVHSPGVIMCILDQDDCFILVRQFRPNLGYYTMEFPAGAIDFSENPIEAAHRELLEETGLDAKFVYLGAYRLQMNRTATQEHLYFGFVNKAEINLPNSSSNSELEVYRVSRHDFFRNLKEGTEFEQLAGLGIVQIVSLKLGVDLVSSRLDEIATRFDLLIREQEV